MAETAECNNNLLDLIISLQVGIVLAPSPFLEGILFLQKQTRKAARKHMFGFV